jgi:acyl-CoA oxidase
VPSEIPNQSGQIAILHSGQYCLTEVGHGLDVLHLETTATLLRDGSFDLHTPVKRAAKYVNQEPGPPSSNDLIARFMPPTSPVSQNFPCISIVFARTIVHEEDHGIKPFFLQLHDGQSITSGVTIKCMAIRPYS